MRHAAAGASFSSSHSVGTSNPARCAARNIASPRIAVTSLPSIPIVQVGCPEGISPSCETVGICDSAGCVYRSSRLIRCPPYRQALCAAAGGRGSGCSRARGSLCLRTCLGGALGGRQVPLRRETPTRLPARRARRSWLHHRFVSATTHRFTGPLGTPLFLYVNLVVVREFPHRRAEDRRRGNAEPAQRNALHVGPELVEPGQIGIAPQSCIRALQHGLD